MPDNPDFEFYWGDPLNLSGEQVYVKVAMFPVTDLPSGVKSYKGADEGFANEIKKLDGLKVTTRATISEAFVTFTNLRGLPGKQLVLVLVAQPAGRGFKPLGKS
jgi:hypothetical protein